MKIYHALDVEMTYQNLGSVWLGILRGIPEQIKLTCNGLFNLQATKGKEEYRNEERTLATFWTSEKAMYKFFYNKHYIPREEGNPALTALREESHTYASSQVATLKPLSETFLVYERAFLPVTFGKGTITAERPDSDMKDAILSHAFVEKDFTKKVDLEQR